MLLTSALPCISYYKQSKLYRVVGDDSRQLECHQAVAGRCHPGGEDFVLNAVTLMLPNGCIHTDPKFRLGSLSTTISLLKTFLMVLTMKIEKVKNRIGLFGLEDS